MIILDDYEFKYEMLSIWQNLLWRANHHLVTPEMLSKNTRNYSKQTIERGFKGDHVVITLDFLNDCVTAFGLASGRTRNTNNNLSWEVCIDLLKPLAAMPPRQGNFWEDKDSDFE